jgi:hypothetical protein
MNWRRLPANIGPSLRNIGRLARFAELPYSNLKYRMVSQTSDRIDDCSVTNSVSLTRKRDGGLTCQLPEWFVRDQLHVHL